MNYKYFVILSLSIVFVSVGLHADITTTVLETDESIEMQISEERPDSLRIQPSPYLGLALSALIPSAGHAYLGEWKASCKYLTVETIAAGMIYFGSQQILESEEHDGYTAERVRLEISPAAVAGLSLYYITRAMELWDVYKRAKEINPPFNNPVEKYIYTVDYGLAFQDSEEDFRYENSSIPRLFRSIYLSAKLSDKNDLVIHYGPREYAIFLEKSNLFGKRNLYYRFGVQVAQSRYANYIFRSFLIGIKYEKYFGKRGFFRLQRNFSPAFKIYNDPLAGAQNTDFLFISNGSPQIGIRFANIELYFGGRVMITGMLRNVDRLNPNTTNNNENQSNTFQIEQRQQMGIGIRILL